MGIELEIKDLLPEKNRKTEWFYTVQYCGIQNKNTQLESSTPPRFVSIQLLEGIMIMKKEIEAFFEEKEIDADVDEMYQKIEVAYEVAYSIENSTKKFTEEQHQNLCTDDEVNKVIEDMQTTIKEMEESQYYRHMIQHLQNDENIRNSILRVLGSGRGNSSGSHKEEEEPLQEFWLLVAVGRSEKAPVFIKTESESYSSGFESRKK